MKCVGASGSVKVVQTQIRAIWHVAPGWSLHGSNIWIPSEIKTYLIRLDPKCRQPEQTEQQHQQQLDSLRINEENIKKSGNAWLRGDSSHSLSHLRKHSTVSLLWWWWRTIWSELVASLLWSTWALDVLSHIPQTSGNETGICTVQNRLSIIWFSLTRVPGLSSVTRDQVEPWRSLVPGTQSRRFYLSILG